MTKKEYARRAHLERALSMLGFTSEESNKLRRISLTLQRWYELEGGLDTGHLERDKVTDKPYMVVEYKKRTNRYPVADREAGALRRLAAIIEARNDRATDTISTYIQTDPRGAALYILRPGDVPAGSDPASCYTSGICVY